MLPESIKIVWISGMPRSGTTWLSQIFASSPDVRLKSCPLFSYEFKMLLDEESTRGEWEKLFLDVYKTNSEYLDQEHLRKHGLVPHFRIKNSQPGYLAIKSNRFHNLTPNILALNPKLKFIYIVRHPCASIYSWLNDPREFPETADSMQEWRQGKCRKNSPGEFWGFDDWKAVTLQALAMESRFSDRFKIVRYECLVKECLKVSAQLFQFIGLEMSEQTIDFISSSSSKHDEDKHSVFKNPALLDTWSDKLDPVIVNEIYEDIIGTELEIFAL